MTNWDQDFGVSYGTYGETCPPGTDSHFELEWYGETCGSGSMRIDYYDFGWSYNNYIWSWTRKGYQWGIPNVTQKIHLTIRHLTTGGECSKSPGYLTWDVTEVVYTPPPPPPPPPPSGYGRIWGYVKDADTEEYLNIGSVIGTGPSPFTANISMGYYASGTLLLGTYSLKTSIPWYEEATASQVVSSGVNSEVDFNVRMEIRLDFTVPLKIGDVLAEPQEVGGHWIADYWVRHVRSKYDKTLADDHNIPRAVLSKIKDIETQKQ